MTGWRSAFLSPRSKEVERGNYRRIERAYGTFTRSFSLPGTVDPERIRAESKNGVLSISLPKRAEAKHSPSR